MIWSIYISRRKRRRSRRSSCVCLDENRKHVYSNGNIVSCFKTQLIYQKKEEEEILRKRKEKETGNEKGKGEMKNKKCKKNQLMK